MPLPALRLLMSAICIFELTFVPRRFLNHVRNLNWLLLEVIVSESDHPSLDTVYERGGGIGVSGELCLGGLVY